MFVRVLHLRAVSRVIIKSLDAHDYPVSFISVDFGLSLKFDFDFFVSVEKKKQLKLVDEPGRARFDRYILVSSNKSYPQPQRGLRVATASAGKCGGYHVRA